MVPTVAPTARRTAPPRPEVRRAVEPHGAGFGTRVPLQPAWDRAVRAVGIAKSATGWVVHLEPVPGVVTVMYVPPLPPFAVRMEPAEVKGHVETLRRLTGALGR